MINDYRNKYLCETTSDLPDLAGASDLYIDFETTSGNPKRSATNPWRDCDILGICITVDEDPRSFYIPLRHALNPELNLPVEPVYKWLREIVRRGKRWINSNVKYDVHVGINYAGLNVDHLELHDIVTLAKIDDSDQFTYGLKELSKRLLHEDISEFEKALRVHTHTPKGVTKNRDWACIPVYDMYKYGTQDALTARRLFKFLDRKIPEDCRPTWDTENALTPALARIERRGLRVDIQKVGDDYSNKIPKILIRCEEKLFELTGERFRPHVSTDCADILCSRYLLPVISWTDAGKPSIDKHALTAYKTYDDAPIEVIEQIELYRHYHQLRSTFTQPYIDKFDINTHKVYGDINQSVRTGRMSMRDPNFQQLSIDAKRYIITDDDRILIEFDLKQIEYRYVASYIQNAGILEEYRTNAAADYHSLMAELCGIDRAPAKNMNFAVSFRAGKKKTIEMLRSAFKREDVPEGVNFDSYVSARGESVFDTYHRRVPELKREWYAAEAVCKQRGYCRNIFGRRRHIRGKGAYMAFPNIIQSSAADLMKRITIRLDEKYRDTEARLLCIVHDSWLFEVPKEEADMWETEIKKTIEETESRLQVPLYASAERGQHSWADCKEND